MPTDYWVDDSTVHSVAATGTIDAYCNLATLIFAKIANFTAEKRKRSGRLADQALTTNVLWRELQEWRSYRPKQALPLLRTEAPQKSAFRTILYTHSSSSKAKHCLSDVVLTVVFSLWQHILPHRVNSPITNRGRKAEWNICRGGQGKLLFTELRRPLHDTDSEASVRSSLARQGA
jgi:hypothetical protein